VLVATHDIQNAARLEKRLIVLDKGRVVSDGTREKDEAEADGGSAEGRNAEGGSAEGAAEEGEAKADGGVEPCTT
jgi:energy-coupling factor transporter ATP-binding protein EcfA2